MKVTLIGSHLCPDTIDAMNKLLAAGCEIEYRDILSCHSDLRFYLALRDSSPAYAEIRGTERLGVPCILDGEGNITLDYNAFIQGLKEEKHND